MARKEKVIFDVENFRYLFDFSLFTSMVFEHGPELSAAVCETNGELLFDMMQDYYEDMLPDVKRREIKIFDKRRIKAHCVELNDGWKVCCIEMPPDINGCSPIICNAFYIAFKEKERQKQKEVKNAKKNKVVQEEEYDDGWSEYDDEEMETEVPENKTEENIISEDEFYITRFFTVEEATNKKDIVNLPIYSGIKFNRRVLCEVFPNNQRKEYGETEKDMLENLIKVGKIIGAIDDTSFEEKKVEINQETGEVLNSDVVPDEPDTTSETDETAKIHPSIPYSSNNTVIPEPPVYKELEEALTDTAEVSSEPSTSPVSDEQENKVETPTEPETTVTDENKGTITVSKSERIITDTSGAFKQNPLPADAEEKVEIPDEPKMPDEPKKEKEKSVLDDIDVDGEFDIFKDDDLFNSTPSDTYDEFAGMEEQFLSQNEDEQPNPYADVDDDIDDENN